MLKGTPAGGQSNIHVTDVLLGSPIPNTNITNTNSRTIHINVPVNPSPGVTLPNCEKILTATISDAANAGIFQIQNLGRMDSQFIPGVTGAQRAADINLPALIVGGFINAGNDALSTNHTPVVQFVAGRDYEPANNLDFGNVINKPLFKWGTGTTTYMRMDANGNICLGSFLNTNTVAAQLHTTGSLRFDNLTFTNDTTFLVLDNNNYVRKSNTRSRYKG